MAMIPKVAPARQPWALGRSPVGAGSRRRRSDREKTPKLPSPLIQWPCIPRRVVPNLQATPPRFERLRSAGPRPAFPGPHAAPGATPPLPGSTAQGVTDAEQTAEPENHQGHRLDELAFAGEARAVDEAIFRPAPGLGTACPLGNPAIARAGAAGPHWRGMAAMGGDGRPCFRGDAWNGAWSVAWRRMADAHIRFQNSGGRGSLLRNRLITFRRLHTIFSCNLSKDILTVTDPG